MTIPSSGAVSFSQIQTEFGGSNPISLNEYYRGGSRVPNGSFTYNIPTSGAIDIQDFRGAKQIYWAGMIYPASYNDGSSDAYGFSAALGVGSVSKTGGSATLNHFFYYVADGKTYVDTSLANGTSIVIQKNLPGTDTIVMNDGQSSATPASNWLTLGGVFVSIALLG